MAKQTDKTGSRTDRTRVHARTAAIIGVDAAPAEEDTSWWPAFLDGLRQWPNIKKACSLAGVGRRTAYDHRERHPDFAKMWDEAYDDGRDQIRSKIQDRSDNSDRILELSARLWLPEYKDDKTVTQLNFDVSNLTDEQLARLANGENPLSVCRSS